MFYVFLNTGLQHWWSHVAKSCLKHRNVISVSTVQVRNSVGCHGARKLMTLPYTDLILYYVAPALKGANKATGIFVFIMFTLPYCTYAHLLYVLQNYRELSLKVLSSEF